MEGNELVHKLWADDGIDPVRFPFLDLYTSIMDLDAAFFLENVRHIYHEDGLARGPFFVSGELVDLSVISRTALLTIEGEFDDIAAPGQTSAVHDLCPTIDNSLRRSLVVPRAGHFSLFHGETWRQYVLPVVREFCSVHGG
jgi:poly(3-hydroxybutyrate) depolymerase